MQNITYELEEANSNYNAALLTAQAPSTSTEVASIFGMNLYYETGNSSLEAEKQFSGNISWMKWRIPGEELMQYGFQYDGLNRMTQAKYEGKDDNCQPINEGAYDVNVGYDIMGNIQTLIRTGMTNDDVDEPEFGIIDNLTYEYAGNQLNSVRDVGSTEKGFKGGTTSYGTYAYGNITQDPAKGISNIIYNFLDLPTEIVSDKGTVKITYDANGSKLKQEILPNDEDPIVLLYHGGLEYKNARLSSIYHEEGRIVYNNTNSDEGLPSNYAEYNITDHLGNTRVRCVDKDNNGKIKIDREDPTINELGASYHYYPFGLQMEGNFFQPTGVKERHRYNGIEHVDEMGIDLSFATYRSHDAAIGRWLQVDPAAEEYYGMTPYNAMGNNPILFNDPNGDILPIIYAGAALIGGAMNLYSNWGSIRGGSAGILDGINYFVSGAAGGATSVVNPLLGAAITGGGNLLTDWSNGTLAGLSSTGEVLGHLGMTALESVAASGAGGLSKSIATGFGWAESGFISNMSSAEIAALKAAEGPAFDLTITQAAGKSAAKVALEETAGTVVNAVKAGTNYVDDALKFTTSSGSLIPSRTYTIFNRFGELHKFGVTDAKLARFYQSLNQAGPGATGKYSSIMYKGKAHSLEKYLRSLHYNSTGQYVLPGMKYPYPIDFFTGLPIKPF